MIKQQEIEGRDRVSRLSHVSRQLSITRILLQRVVLNSDVSPR
jgi:hypothetical protein